MKLELCSHTTKCDFYGCLNSAKYSFEKDGFRSKRVHLCEQCVRAIYEEIGRFLTPKAVENPFKKPIKTKGK